jgi:hypothetical protein
VASRHQCPEDGELVVANIARYVTEKVAGAVREEEANSHLFSPQLRFELDS